MRTEENTHKNNVASYFSHSVNYWDEVYGNNGEHVEAFSGYAKSRRKGIVLEYLDGYARERSLAVLDIGCGPGVFMANALQRGHMVTGIDISEEMVRKAHERLRGCGHGNFTCRQGDMESIPLGNESVDIVLCLGVIPYLHDDRKAIEEIDRVLRRGGMVIVILSNLFKLSTLLDPYYYFVRCWQYLWYVFLGKNETPGRVLDPQSFGNNRDFSVRRHTRSQAAKLFGSYGTLPEENITAIEFGPLTFWRRKIVSDRISIALSEFLARRSQRWTWLKKISNEWVIFWLKPQE